MRTEREQKLVNILFECVAAVSSEPAAQKFQALPLEERMAWVANQLEQCGFPTRQAGSSWGVLIYKHERLWRDPQTGEARPYSRERLMVCRGCKATMNQIAPDVWDHNQKNGCRNQHKTFSPPASWAYPYKVDKER